LLLFSALHHKYTAVSVQHTNNVTALGYIFLADTQKMIHLFEEKPVIDKHPNHRKKCI